MSLEVTNFKTHCLVFTGPVWFLLSPPDPPQMVLQDTCLILEVRGRFFCGAHSYIPNEH